MSSFSSSSSSSSSSETSSLRKLPTGKRVVPVVVPAAIPTVVPTCWAKTGGAWSKVSPPITCCSESPLASPPFPSIGAEAIPCDSVKEGGLINLSPKLPLTVVSDLADPIVTLLPGAGADAAAAAASENDTDTEEDAAEDNDGTWITPNPTRSGVPKAKPTQPSLADLKAEVNAARITAKESLAATSALMKKETAEIAGWCVKGVLAENKWLADLTPRPGKHWTGFMPQSVTVCTISASVFQSTGRPVAPALEFGHVRGQVADLVGETMDAQADGFSVFVQLSDDKKALRVILRKIADASTPTVEPPIRAPRTSDGDQARAPRTSDGGQVRAYAGGAAERARAQGGK